MNPNEMTDKELEAWLGEVLQPEPSKHKVYARKFKTDKDTVWCCHKCNVESACCSNMEGMACGIPDPIPLDDWNVAMKWRDWAGQLKHSHHRTGQDVFYRTLKSICHEVSPIANSCMHMSHYAWWLANEAQPRHYLIAAAKLKEKSNG